jgi:hypothetical protein
MNTRNFRSSSISISFWLPLAGCGILSVGDREFFSRWGTGVTHEGDVLARAMLADIRNCMKRLMKTHQLHLDEVAGQESGVVEGVD